MLPLKISKKHHRHLNNPFPSAPRSLRLVHGTLSHGRNLPHQVYEIGEVFRLLWSSDNGGYLSVFHKSHPNRSLWSTIPGEAFVSAGVVKSEAVESRGSFAINDGHVYFICDYQTIDEIILCEDGFEMDVNGAPNELLKGANFPVLLISGRVSSKEARPAYKGLYSWARKLSLPSGRKSSVSARYWVLFHQKNIHQLEFQVKFGELEQGPGPGLIKYQKFAESFHSQRRKRVQNGRRSKDFHRLSSDDVREEKLADKFNEFNRVFLTYSSEKDERFYGFGEQFSHMEFKGRRVPILVQEQGIGRGDQPITFAANLVSYRSGGDWSTTYAPSPFYMTSKMRCLFLEGYNYSVFDLTEHDRVQIQVHGSYVAGRILSGCSPVELIEHYTETIGRPPVLPIWIMAGAVIGMQGGTVTVRKVWNQLKDHDVPVSAFWLQDWVGKRKTIIGSQLWWNWEVDNTHYTGWRELVNDLRANNIRVMAYCNPCLVPVTKEKPNKNKDLFKEADNLDIMVKNKNGSTYMIPNTSFDVGMLDFTHPNASCWFKNVLNEMVECGVRGWMADFGEGLPLDANIFSGEDPITAHNKYPELWARVNREFIDEWKSKCRGKEWEEHEESLVFFMRAGFRESPKWAMLFWEGDQMVSWQKNDGIKSSVTGLLSSGLSGFAFNHSDIGGYCTVDFPMIKYRRSEELLMRWMELNAFNIVYRTHEGNKPESNCQFYSNDRTLSHFSRFAKVYKAWMFYRVELVEDASKSGLPITRHLFLHYPDDEYVHSLNYQQFLVGTEILVVPVLDKGKKRVKAYIPLGWGCSWQHIWTGKIFCKSSCDSENARKGIEVWVEAPIGYPAIFVKFGSRVGEQFMKNMQDFGIL